MWEYDWWNIFYFLFCVKDRIYCEDKEVVPFKALDTKHVIPTFLAFPLVVVTRHWHLLNLWYFP